ncbi:MAG: UDP-N-acetylmuramoyl-L-alanyl-D-glutamate--2,6-diaminopimelate ligase [Candidatus Wildermuthbacteria bacterium]|nr:UDP-N-acetylmuramoyl-L-alanyl-D-glutamate--2,6-diaminopimelate ligase [Candidatus Wildermuthbacteria bacterium]
MLGLVRKLVPPFLLSWYHLGLAFLGALLFRFPSRGMVVIGVTGTNGKSTTVDMISRIFREAGLKAASLSSIRFQLLDKEWRNTMKMTMPGRFVIQQFLRKAKDAGCTHFVLEVTSEGILQHRHRFINFHTAVFTNLSPEHIERHGSFENYKRTKGKLFATAKKAHVINVDDEHSPFFLQFPAQKIHTYSILSLTKAEIKAENVRENGGLRFTVQGVEFHMNLLGRFNIANALATIAVARSQGISLSVCSKALERMVVVPGRMETVVKDPFRVVVDYAFTPAALEKVYKTFKSAPSSDGAPRVHHGAKLICVLGAAGGGRDKWKRPVLGKIAATHCDQVIITNEDPYEEDPVQILSQIKSGISNSQFPMSNFYEILDRRQAIAKALSFASSGDVVIITGKGSEDSIQVKGGKKIPWDDREVVREEIQIMDKAR